MAGNGKVTAEIERLFVQDNLAYEVSAMYENHRQDRRTWEEEKKELRSYLFATDTTKTTNSKLPWKNKTTRPKLCQIRDNLHANYVEALFPNENWLHWEAADNESANRDKAKNIEAYMRAKLHESGFEDVVSQALYDYIDYGNAFGDVEFVRDEVQVGDKTVVRYVGPRAVRVSPLDIVFNVAAENFQDTPKITRYLLTLGDIKQMIDSRPDQREELEQAFTHLREIRQAATNFDVRDINKLAGWRVDGFGNMKTYYSSGFVELLVFEGDMYDAENDELYKNHRIVIADRSVVLYKEPIPSWLGSGSKVHAGWRLRPDNLMAMGPLDNLVGLQYRIDHIENLKADAFDLIVHPPLRIQGHVEDFEWGPGERIYEGEEGQVNPINIPDNTMVANMEIRGLEESMEEMAGAPREAMGIRTPGEKTAFEIQALENAAGRIFQHKIRAFEKNFLEPLLNHMLEVARRNMDEEDIIRAVGDDLGVTEFLKINRGDLQLRGRLRATGARHFAMRAQVMQNLQGLFAGPLANNPTVMAHFSGSRIARLVEDFLGVRRFELVRDYVQVHEEGELVRQQNAVQKNLEQQGAMPGPEGEEGPPMQGEPQGGPVR